MGGYLQDTRVSNRRHKGKNGLILSRHLSSVPVESSFNGSASGWRHWPGRRKVKSCSFLEVEDIALT